jgi:ribosome-associated heat shock protein Hsp15
MDVSDRKTIVTDAGEPQRLDKWLWFARFAKTRSLAQRLVIEGAVRVNRERVVKPSQSIKPGDLITVKLGDQLRLLKVLAGGERRGPAVEAALLYEDLAPPPAAGIRAAPDDPAAAAPAQREPGSGRPTKRERRQLDKWRDG